MTLVVLASLVGVLKRGKALPVALIFERIDSSTSSALSIAERRMIVWRVVEWVNKHFSGNFLGSFSIEEMVAKSYLSFGVSCEADLGVALEEEGYTLICA